jgi:hypothetical protein
MVSRRLGLLILVVGLLLVSTVKAMFAPFALVVLGTLGLTLGAIVVVLGLLFLIFKRK